jgi:endonuclease/exonuclease/phosphatase (EEP) superfamily protein YafD
MTQTGNTAKFFRVRICLWGLGTACGAIASTATVLGCLGRFWWFWDLFSHFRVQYLLGLSAVALLLLLSRWYKTAACFGLFAVVNFCMIVPLYFGAEPQPAAASRSYRGLLVNVNTAAGDPAKVARAIEQLAPDIVALEEVNDWWMAALAAPLRAYPYSRAMPRGDNFGIALYSKHPLVRGEIRRVGEADVPSVVAEVELPDGRLTLITTHPLPPSGAEYSRLRNDQLARLPETVKQAQPPVLLLGDLNATPWCSHFKRLLRRAGLRDSSQGRGVLSTWPTFSPMLRIPIDHCLHTAGIHVTSKAIGPDVGSDHYPLVVDFVLTSPNSKGRQPTATPSGARPLP